AFEACEALWTGPSRARARDGRRPGAGRDYDPAESRPPRSKPSGRSRKAKLRKKSRGVAEHEKGRRAVAKFGLSKPKASPRRQAQLVETASKPQTPKGFHISSAPQRP